MSDKNKFDDDDFEIEFEEDSELLENTDDTEKRNDTEVSDNDDMTEEDDYRVDFDYDEFVDDSETKGKLTRNQIVNRVMIGLGAAIAGFTIFYGVVAYGIFHKDKGNNSVEQETTPVQEQTTEQQDETFFISSNSDENISEEVKALLNAEKRNAMKTGLSKVDKLSDEIIQFTCKDDATTYDNVRNIYDYMMYYYTVKSSSYVDSDSIYDYCSSMDYISEYDMEILYRAGKLFKDKAGDSKDYACGFTVLLRNLGLEAYYIDGEMMGEEDDDYESHGYTVVVLDNKQYIFDVAEEDLLSGDKNSTVKTEEELTVDSTEEGQTGNEPDKQDSAKVEYKVFCKTFDELEDKYSDERVEDSIDAFGSFKTLGKLTFTTKASTSDGDSTSASITYSKNDNVAVLDDMTIDLYDNVYLSGNVSGSTTNTWKLIVRMYDKNMDYITESTLYNETTNTSSNEVTYRAGRGGYMKLLYVVTDEHGRTCTATMTVKVNAPEEETTAKEPEEPTTTEEEKPTGNTSSAGQLG